MGHIFIHSYRSHCPLNLGYYKKSSKPALDVSAKPIGTQPARSEVHSCRPEISSQGNAPSSEAPQEAEKFTLSHEGRLGASIHEVIDLLSRKGLPDHLV